MKPETFISFWEVRNDSDECIVQFLSRDQAVGFMQGYGEPGWWVLQRTLYFADDIDPRKVYDEVTVEVEGDWIDFRTANDRLAIAK